MVLVCQMLIMMIVNWSHLDFNSVKVLCIVPKYQKINIRYLKFDVPMCLYFFLITAFIQFSMFSTFSFVQ